MCTPGRELPYGKSRSVPGYDGRSGIRRKARDEWLALIPMRTKVTSVGKTGGGDPQDGQRQCTGQSPSWSAEAWRRSACRAIPVGEGCSTTANHVASPSAVCGSMTRSKRHFSAWSSQEPLPPPLRWNAIWPNQRDQAQDALMRDLEAARYVADRAFRQESLHFAVDLLAEPTDLTLGDTAHAHRLDQVVDRAG